MLSIHSSAFVSPRFRCPSPVILEDRRALYSKETLKLNTDQKKEGQSGRVAPTLREDS